MDCLSAGAVCVHTGQLKYGQSKLILLQSIKTNTACTIYISDYLRMELFLKK